jgi:3-hydroxyanthranilate 3,4-dioxygenase
MLLPINLPQWIEEHREQLKPPVCNRCVWQDSDFIIMLVGGPNVRDDYHVNKGEEFFYQLQGTMELGVIEQGVMRSLPLGPGDILLLPPNVPHQPRRTAGSVGLVVERKRAAHELDGFQWYCDDCGHKLYEEFLYVSDIVSQLPPVFARFYGDPLHYTCKQCQAVKPRREL